MYYKINDFEKIVLTQLNEVIIEFKLNKTSSTANSVDIANQYCIIKILIDGITIYADIVNPKDTDNEKYSIDRVYHLIKNKTMRKNFDQRDILENIKQQLSVLNNTLITELPNLLKGDFSWKAQYKNRLDVDKKIHEYLYNLKIDDPIYIKYKNSDPSWRDDIISIIRKNN